MTDKNSVLEEALKAIEKQFGKGSIMKLWDNTVHSIVKTYHTGSYMIDDILWGGYPEGRIIEIYGPESSGKTTLALHAIAEVQKAWENAAFIDAEHALDPSYAQKLGVDINNLVLAQPDYGEQALEIAEQLASTGAVKLIVVDSVAALTPKAEVEWDMSDQQMWLQARMMSKWLRKLTSIAAKN
jgi:recombination protein RecA